jgi:hypothetical protein
VKGGRTIRRGGGDFGPLAQEHPYRFPIRTLGSFDQGRGVGDAPATNDSSKPGNVRGTDDIHGTRIGKRDAH